MLINTRYHFESSFALNEFTPHLKKTHALVRISIEIPNVNSVKNGADISKISAA